MAAATPAAGGYGENRDGGGGGGSYIDSSFIAGTTSIVVDQTGNGEVTITGPAVSAVPEPGSVLLLGSVVAIFLRLAVRRKLQGCATILSGY
ncbi:MAG TPA: PEP-CTERM sorting domain-containing protein [Bryobacteraceae bacterium]